MTTLGGGRYALDDDVTLHDAGLDEEETEISVKDLGPQISWRTVFLVEYVRPLPFSLTELSYFAKGWAPCHSPFDIPPA
jgi:hypothetical protein